MHVPLDMARGAKVGTNRVHYAALPAWVNMVVLYLVKALLPGYTARLLQLELACLVSGFAGLPLDACSTFYLKASEL